jgi:alkaline phosphatase D
LAVLTACLLAAVLAPATFSRIAFGSCADQDRPQPIWGAVMESQPDLFVFLGDNVYASDPARRDIRAQYAKLAQVEGFAKLRASTPILAIWDDHDFGKNDAGAEHEGRYDAKRAFREFWGLAADSERARREGLYDSQTFGPVGRRVQIVLLDTRWFRSPLQPKPEGDPGPGRYVPASVGTMLGEAQWAWLEGRLREPAELRLIVSSVQVVAEDHRWEKWGNFPHERARLFDLIRRTGANGVVFLSGDRHLGEISMIPDAVGYPLFDVTASALNVSHRRWRPHEPNRWRVGSMNFGDNFGLIVVDWGQPDPVVRLQLRDEDGEVTIQQRVPLSWLRPAAER